MAKFIKDTEGDLINVDKLDFIGFNKENKTVYTDIESFNSYITLLKIEEKDYIDDEVTSYLDKLTIIEL